MTHHPWCTTRMLCEEFNIDMVYYKQILIFIFRLDLLPFYSRLVATLSPCLAEIAPDLVYLLKGSFLSHVSFFVPGKHTTLFWRPTDVHSFQTTLNRRPNNVLCYQGLFFYNLICLETIELVSFIRSLKFHSADPWKFSDAFHNIIFPYRGWRTYRGTGLLFSYKNEHLK